MKTLDEMITYICTADEYKRFWPHGYEDSHTAVILAATYDVDARDVMLSIKSLRIKLEQERKVRARAASQLANEERRQANLKKLQTQ
jgi:hypothetical protein